MVNETESLYNDLFEEKTTLKNVLPTSTTTSTAKFTNLAKRSSPQEDPAKILGSSKATLYLSLSF